MKIKQKLIYFLAKESTKTPIKYSRNIPRKKNKTEYFIRCFFGMILLLNLPLARADYKVYFNNNSPNSVTTKISGDEVGSEIRSVSLTIGPLKKDSIIYKDCNKLDCGAAKDALYVEIKKGNSLYHIFGTHLQATEGASIAAGDQAARDRQFTQLMGFIKKQDIAKNQAVVIGGDLNIDYEACYLNKDCGEYHKTIQAVNNAYPACDNRNVLLFGSDPSKNLMNTDPAGEREDYVLPFSKDYLAPVSQQSHISVLREPAISMKYDGGSQILHNPFGDLDLSDHFMLESTLSYSSTKKIPITNATQGEKKQPFSGFIPGPRFLLNSPESTDKKVNHSNQPDVRSQPSANNKNVSTVPSVQIDFNKNKQTIEGCKAQELTTVPINDKNQASSVKLNLKGIVGFTSIWKSVALTDATHRWQPNSQDVKLKENNAMLTITIPANSVVTLRSESVVT